MTTMRKHHRIIITICGCLIAISASIWLTSHLYPSEMRLTGDTASETTTIQDRNCSPAQINRLTDQARQAKRVACENASHDRNNYIQSRRSADASEAQAAYALQQTKIAAIGAGAGLLTMCAAIAAAGFAWGSIHETRRIGEAQTRAYLSLKSLSVRKMKEGLEFQPVVHNSGQSPALSAQIQLKIIRPSGEWITLMPEHEHNITAQTTEDMAYCYLVDSEAKMWAGIVVEASIAYADVFGKIDMLTTKFAGNPDKWLDDTTVELVAGMHIASYLRSTTDL
ncbi:hypothetical protein [Sphingomonas sp. MMS24-J13]|uniref:hypothetical protein n=1 Tax=Sphingomonas sp. MMS24-J13 TaxID=3238686 RepID=UPI0038516A40